MKNESSLPSSPEEEDEITPFFQLPDILPDDGPTSSPSTPTTQVSNEIHGMPLSLYSTANNDFYTDEEIEDIANIPLDPTRAYQHLHPKPPPHVIAADTWRQCIISIATYMMLSIEEQKKEAKKYKSYGCGELKRYRRKINKLDCNQPCSRPAPNPQEPSGDQNEEEDVFNHTGMGSTQEEQDMMLLNKKKKAYKWRKIGVSAPSLAAQSD
eukprot:1692213-Ditylum_brightwellii.AAC.1